MIAEWTFDDEGLPYERSALHRKMFLLIGPSGVGKTTLAEALQARLPGRLRIIRNHTTRSPRPDDHLNHFVFLTDSQFRHLLVTHSFYIALGKVDRAYGYLKSEFASHAAAQQRSLFMFRNNGARRVLATLPECPAVFLESEPALIQSHSRESARPLTIKDIKSELQANLELFQSRCARDAPTISIHNTFMGDSEILQHTETIVSFMERRSL